MADVIVHWKAGNAGMTRSKHIRKHTDSEDAIKTTYRPEIVPCGASKHGGLRTLTNRRRYKGQDKTKLAGKYIYAYFDWHTIMF